MPRLGDGPDPWVMKREFSPDRRLALDWLPFPDPRTAYELEAPEAVALRDAETGARLAEFGGWAMLEKHEWPAAGGVELELLRGVRLKVAPDLATFTPGNAPAAARPIAELPDWLRGLVPPPTPIPPPSRLALLVAIVLLGLLLAAAGYGLSRLEAVQDLAALIRGDAPERRGTGGIDAWMVSCPGIGPSTSPAMSPRTGLAPMSLTPEGRLRVPAAIAAEPLPPLDDSGRRFGDGRTAIEVDGMDVTWWPHGLGQPSVRCPSTARQGS